jgi:hypothetical protein
MRSMTRAARIVGAAVIVLLTVFNPWTRPVALAGSTPARAGDFNGDGKAELAVYVPATATWKIQGLSDVVFGRLGDILVPADYNGDGVQEIAHWGVWDGGGHWASWFVAGQPAVQQCGSIGDIPAPADYDGDGKAEFALFSQRYYPLFARCAPGSGLTGFKEFPGSASSAGQRSDIPVPADYNGDGKAEPALYRPATGVGPGEDGFGVVGLWLVDGMNDVQWGALGDTPVPADYDGDGSADIAVFRPAASGSWWYVRGVGSWMFGRLGDIPLPQDVDGDGTAELVLYRPSTGTWLIYFTGTGTLETVPMGTLGDVPVLLPAYYQLRRTTGDAEGDRARDFTVFRPSDGMWWTRFSSGDNSSWETSTWQGIPWGGPGDVPAPGDYDGDGRMDPAIFRPSDGMWWVRLSSGDNSTWETSTWRSWQLGGQPGDIPLPGDYDGDGRTDPAVARVYTSSPGTRLDLRWLESSYGYSMDERGTLLPNDPSIQVLAADFYGDGRTELAGCWNSGQSWRIVWTGGKFDRSWPWLNFDNAVCVAADFDGDGRADLGVYAPATGQWAWLLSSTDFRVVGGGWYWGGMPGDVPVPGDYDGDGRADLAIYRPSDGMWWVLFSSSGYRTWQGVLWGTLPDDNPVPRR